MIITALRGVTPIYAVCTRGFRCLWNHDRMAGSFVVPVVITVFAAVGRVDATMHVAISGERGRAVAASNAWWIYLSNRT